MGVNIVLIPRPTHIIGIIQRLTRTAILHTIYNQWTIAQYFRKQGAQIGVGCSIKTHSLGQEPYLVRIGEHVFIAEGVVFRTRYGGVWIFRKEIPDLQAFGPIIIEDNCIIGQNVILLPNIRIGMNSIVEPGSVVNSDIPPDSVVMGIPARVVSSVNEYQTRFVTLWNEQKPSDSYVEKGRNWWTSSHYKKNIKKLRGHLEKLYMQGK